MGGLHRAGSVGSFVPATSAAAGAQLGPVAGGFAHELGPSFSEWAGHVGGTRGSVIRPQSGREYSGGAADSAAVGVVHRAVAGRAAAARAKEEASAGVLAGVAFAGAGRHDVQCEQHPAIDGGFHESREPAAQSGVCQIERGGAARSRTAQSVGAGARPGRANRSGRSRWSCWRSCPRARCSSRTGSTVAPRWSIRCRPVAWRWAVTSSFEYAKTSRRA